MRYPPGHKEKTRFEIIKAAARVFMENGYHGSGIDGIMAEAGLTSGGFYSHFKNKSDLLINMINSWHIIMSDLMPEELKEKVGPDWVTGMGDWYLSPENRDSNDLCCPITRILSEVGLQNESVHKAYTESTKVFEDSMAHHLTNFPEEERHEVAKNILMISTGAITTARAMGATQESDAYLEDAKQFIHKLYFK